MLAIFLDVGALIDMGWDAQISQGHPPSTAVGVSIHRARLSLRELESLWQDQPPAPRAPRQKPEVGTGAR